MCLRGRHRWNATRKLVSRESFVVLLRIETSTLTRSSPRRYVSFSPSLILHTHRHKHQVRENSKVDDVRAETNFIESIMVKDLNQTLKTREKAAHERQKGHIRSIVEKQKYVSKKVAEANERRKRNEERIAANQKKRLEEASRRREELLKQKISRLKSPTEAPTNVWLKSSPTSPPRLPAWARRHRDSKKKKKKDTAGETTSSAQDEMSSSNETSERSSSPIKMKRDKSRTPSPKKRQVTENKSSPRQKNVSPVRYSLFEPFIKHAHTQTHNRYDRANHLRADDHPQADDHHNLADHLNHVTIPHL